MMFLRSIRTYRPSTSLRSRYSADGRQLAESGLRIGIAKEYFVEGLDREVDASLRAAIKQIEGLDAKVVEVSLPHTQYAIPVYYLILFAEASSNLAKYDGVRYGFSERNADSLIELYLKTREKGFGAETKRRIMLGTFALSAGYYDAYYLKAQKVRTWGVTYPDFCETIIPI